MAAKTEWVLSMRWAQSKHSVSVYSNNVSIKYNYFIRIISITILKGICGPIKIKDYHPQNIVFFM